MNDAATKTTHGVPRSPHDFRLIAVKAHRDPRTVQAAYAGTASPNARAAVADAAVALGFTPPPSAA